MNLLMWSVIASLGLFDIILQVYMPDFIPQILINSMYNESQFIGVNILFYASFVLYVFGGHVLALRTELQPVYLPAAAAHHARFILSLRRAQKGEQTNNG